MAARNKMEPEEIKCQLEAYLEKRRLMNADEVAKQYVSNVKTYLLFYAYSTHSRFYSF
jgi:hypothetical protein